ncbi:hypothetical protein G8759_05190 [Spirosoma aureum]|uniref:Lipocalin-like domain-containing protein n=1 Tax=Spirosoma aureum TaxID=2692134 RepID=A0A6G9AID0_9BACT|nr:hypothetical protein [Spirosoma aureum]QIP12066.1 hypothetical protein G8759_05190 [Spirosoma aureum]
MKRYVYLFCLVISLAGLISCSKSSDPTPPPAAVGRWELNRGIASSFPASLSINGAAIDLYYLNSEGSTLDVYADNTFNENYRQVGVSDGEGTWDFTNNTLTLKYNSGGQDAYTYAKTKNIEELTQVTPLTYTLPTSSTSTASGKIQWVYRK